VDLAFEKIPDGIKPFLKKEYLIETERTVYTTLHCAEEIERHNVKTTQYVVFHLQQQFEKSIELLDNVCFFEGNVSVIRIRPEDLERARILNISADINDVKVEAALRFADPGFILATIFNQSAIDKTRAIRGMMILASQDKDEFKETVNTYIEIVKANGLTDGHGNAALSEPFAMLKNHDVRKQSLVHVISMFSDQVQTAIGKIK
jgi:hypothetical protein